MRPTFNLDEISQFINQCSPETKVYLGADSERVCVDNKWYVDYLLCVVVHINGNNGCRVFGHIERELDHDKNLKRPKHRLINEVYKIVGVYLQLQDLVAHDIDIHLDINPDERFGSNCVISEAIGYVKGVCGIQPKVKPEAWAASSVSDQLKRILC